MAAEVVTEPIGDQTQGAKPLSWHWYAGIGVLWFATLWVMGAVGDVSTAAELLVSSGYMAVLGALCWYNGRQCGALHCVISGPGYIGAALLGVLAAAGVVPLTVNDLFLVFGAVVVVSYGAEVIAAQRSSSVSE